MKPNDQQMETPYGRLAYRSSGNPSAPKLLAVHGWLDNLASFEPLAPYLTDYHLVAIDLPGHGFSDPKPQGTFYHLSDSVPVIEYFVSQLGWNSFSWLGHSMGGGIGVLFAGARPAKIQKLALIENLGPLSDSPEKAAARMGRFLDQNTLVAQKRPPGYDTWVEAWTARNAVSPLDKTKGQALIERALQLEDGKLKWRSDPRLRLESPWRITEPQVLSFIESITCPTLVIQGEQGLPFDAKQGEARFSKLKHGKIVKLPGHHHLHIDSPEIVGPVIRDFLKS